MRSTKILALVFLAWWFGSVGKSKSLAPDIPNPMGPFDTEQTCLWIRDWFLKDIEGRASPCWSDGVQYPLCNGDENATNKGGKE